MKTTYYPMLAQDGTIVNRLEDGKIDIDCKEFDNPEWIGEIKYDGARYILQWDEEGKVYLTSRCISTKDNMPVDKTENLRGYMYDDCKNLAGIAIDGEILVQTKNDKGEWVFPKGCGSSEVNKIMGCSPDKAKERLKNENIRVIYMAYDCLKALSTDITEKGVIARKRVLEDVLCVTDKELGDMSKNHIKLSQVFVHLEGGKSKGVPKWMFQNILDAGHEGMMLKRVESSYQQGEHSKDWLKVKNCQTYDGVVMGLNMGKGKYAETMGALVVGQFIEVDGLAELAALNTFLEVDEKKPNEIFEWEWENYFYRWEVTDCVIDSISLGEGGLTLNVNEDSKLKLRKIYKLKEVCTISGMTDEQRNEYYKEFEAKLGTECYQEGDKIRFAPRMLPEGASCVEFLAQEKSMAGKRYRHPRFIQKREDKNLYDCLF